MGTTTCPRMSLITRSRGLPSSTPAICARLGQRPPAACALKRVLESCHFLGCFKPCINTPFCTVRTPLLIVEVACVEWSKDLV